MDTWYNNLSRVEKKKQYQTLDKEELNQTLKDKTLPEPTNKMKRNAALLTENRQQMWSKETRKEETKIPGRRWEQRTVRAFESTDAIACADTDPPCYCTILPTPAALPFASPNTAKPPFCPHTLTLSQTQSFPLAAAHRSQAYTDLLCSAKCFARSAHNTRPCPRVVVVVRDSAGLIRVSFLAWQQFFYFVLKKHFGVSFLGNNKKSAFLFCAKYQFSEFLNFWIQIWKKNRQNLEKNKKTLQIISFLPVL